MEPPEAHAEIERERQDSVACVQFCHQVGHAVERMHVSIAGFQHGRYGFFVGNVPRIRRKRRFCDHGNRSINPGNVFIRSL